MHSHVALAIAKPVHELSTHTEMIAHAPTLDGLVMQVRPLAPAAKVRVFRAASFVLIDERPIWGIVTGDPGRSIFLCGPEVVIPRRIVAAIPGSPRRDNGD